MSRETVGRPMEILLVEDNLEDARVTIQALKQGDVRCRVSIVRDGEEAIQFLNRKGILARVPRPDLILLDMELPKKGGREVLAEVRSHELLKDVPVVVLTASLVHKAILEGEKLRVEGFMTKPVDLEQFIGIVRSLRRYWLDEVVLPKF